MHKLSLRDLRIYPQATVWEDSQAKANLNKENPDGTDSVVLKVYTWF
jgi:hypothetical protein